MAKIIRDYYIQECYQNVQPCSINYAPLLKIEEDVYEELWYPVSCRENLQDIPRIMKYNTPVHEIYNFSYHPHPKVNTHQDDNFYLHITFDKKCELNLFLKQYKIINEIEDQLEYKRSTYLNNDTLVYKDRHDCTKTRKIYSVILTLDRGWIASPFNLSILSFLLRLISYISIKGNTIKEICEECRIHYSSDQADYLEGCDNDLIDSLSKFDEEYDVIDIIKNINKYSLGNPITFANDDLVAHTYKHGSHTSYDTLINDYYENINELLRMYELSKEVEGLDNVPVEFEIDGEYLHQMLGFHNIFNSLSSATYRIKFARNRSDNEYPIHSANTLIIGLCLKSIGYFNE